MPYDLEVMKEAISEERRPRGCAHMAIRSTSSTSEIGTQATRAGSRDSSRDSTQDKPANAGSFDGATDEQSSVLEASAPSSEQQESRRDERGRFLPGHAFSLKTGAHSMRVRDGVVLDAYVHRAALIEDRVTAILSDLGGRETVSAMRLALVENFAGLANVADFQLADLSAHGLMTSKGRTRAMFSAYLGTIDRMTKLADKIGLERGARLVGDFDPAEHAARTQRERQQQETSR